MNFNYVVIAYDGYVVFSNAVTIVNLKLPIFYMYVEHLYFTYSSPFFNNFIENLKPFRNRNDF